MRRHQALTDLPWRELGMVLLVKAIMLLAIWWLFFAEDVPADLPARLLG